MLLSGDDAFGPVQYVVPPSNVGWSLVDKWPRSTSLDSGEQLTMSFVWPDTGQDTVTAAYEYSNTARSQFFRLTDIPVVEASRR